ncbi:hypothetical protein VQ045_20125, partial [Aurantimonas sp. E1-2-R+4]
QRHAKGPDRIPLHVGASVAKGVNIPSEMGGTVRSDLTAERTIDALWTTVGTLIDRFEATECASCFKAAGYDAS